MKKPFITLKFGQTLDGRIAARDGSSRWISSAQSLKFAHKLRREHDAVLVGVRTVIRDNPGLTTRFVKGKSPTRIIIDGKLRIPLNSKVVNEISNKYAQNSVRLLIIRDANNLETHIYLSYYDVSVIEKTPTPKELEDDL